MLACEFEVVYSGAIEREAVAAQQIRPAASRRVGAEKHRPVLHPVTHPTRQQRRARTHQVAEVMRTRRGYPWTVAELAAATSIGPRQVFGAVTALLHQGEIVPAERLTHIGIPRRYRWLGKPVIW